MYRIYNCEGFNRVEEQRIKQIERAKLTQLLEQERRLADFLAEHHAALILQNPRQPLAAVEDVVNQIFAHPQIKETAYKVNNILNAYREFNGLANRIGERTRSNVRNKLRLVGDAVRSPF